MRTSELACVFVRAPPERLVAAERLLRAFPHYLRCAEGEVDLYHCGASGYLAAVVRAPPAALSDEVIARVVFWAARTGGRVLVVAALSDDERRRLHAELNLCERVLKGTPLASFGEGAARFFRQLGSSPPPAHAGEQPVLAVDLDGPGGEGIGYRPEAHALFLAGVLAPPKGDQLTVAVRERGRPQPLEGWATVVDVRRREDAGPGRPAGFTLRIEGPNALHELLAARARRQPKHEVRAAPRYPVKAPVKVTPALPPLPPVAPAAAQTPPPRALIEYATEQELQADWLENLSQGGAFVRTSRPQPQGTEVRLELALPDGARLEAQGVVVFTSEQGMGIRFSLAAEQDAILAAAIARISARSRRALVVDDDALVRRMLGDALVARGFEVVSAGSADEGVKVLSEELLALDLLVTDVCMPGRDGEDLVRFIRKVGGEADLAIVAVSGRLEPGMEPRLEAAGADAVLDKSLGPDLIAQAADAVLERKRLVAAAAEAAAA